MNARRMIASLGAVALLAATGAGFAEPHGGGGGGAHFSGGGGGAHSGGGGGGHAGGFSGGHGGGDHFASPGHAAPQERVAPGYAAGGFRGPGPTAHVPGARGGYGPGYPHAASGHVFRPGVSAATGWGYRGHWGGGYWHGAYWPRVYYGWNYPVFLVTLPALYATYWWGGIPYYYVNDVYYTWNAADSGYVATDPPPLDGDAGGDPGGDADYATPADGPPPADAPPPVDAAAAAPVPGSFLPGEVFAYPRNGQSEEQQATDKYECHKWAQSQSGFDPTASASASNRPANRAAYRRALAACLDGRGYSTR